ncbi:amino acid adenylation domain-containing protein [Paenibacillus sp. PK1-4R]|nr:non-ribosomal peptide synthetase [Paenibacillus sp. PK1-4R]WJM11232.1 amino acid adenylation domain-containing protein [Paenibacillus sp. PK1-4R]
MEESDYGRIEPAAAQASYPLSSAQRRLYVLHEMEPESTRYNMPGVIELTGKIDEDRLAQAIRSIIQRHESLRTSFIWVDGEPRQQVHEDVPLEWIYREVDEAEAREFSEQFVRPFALEQAPLLRAALLRLAEDRYWLVWDMHHIVSDGVSMTLLVSDFMTAYTGEELTPLRIQYKDYAVWQQSTLEVERMQAHEAYWLTAYAEEVPVLELPTDRTRPSVPSSEGGQVNTEVNAKTVEALKQIATDTGATLYMVLLAAYNVWLHKYTGQTDIVVGTPVSGRTHGDTEPMIGMFVNTLALRNAPSGDKPFMDFVREVKEWTLAAFEHQDYPFEELVEQLNVRRDLSRNPLFDTMLVLQNMEETHLELANAEVRPVELNHPTTKFDFTLNVVEREPGLQLTLEYSRALFNEETVERYLRHFVQLVSQMIAQPEASIGSYELVTLEEKQQLHAFNDTAAKYPREATIHGLFEAQVEKTPDAVAVVYGDQQLTYAELNTRANQLAWTLREHGVGAECIVAIMAERSLELMVGLYGILKAGGAYLPIDPSLPAERIGYMLRDSGTAVLLLDPGQDPCGFEGAVVELAPQGQTQSESNPPLEQDSDSLAYVIYTSGTTGNPKGVMIEHRSVINRLQWMQHRYPIGEQGVILQKTPITFDVSVWELFWWGMTGARVCLLPPQGEKDPVILAETIERHGVTVMHFVPSMLSVFLEQAGDAFNREQLGSLRRVFASGEALKPQQVTGFYKLMEGSEATLHNLYGPTEATVDVTYYDSASTFAEGVVPIGKPIANTQLYIVNDHRQLQPMGVAGELCIAGEGLARGYLNQPELTAEKFVDNPFEPGTKMYRTGDLARWLPDGNLEYLGRIDHQVKIRGYRIECGEIEVQLLTHVHIREAVVVAREDEQGQTYLCAYLVSDEVVPVAELRDHLAAQLLDYMIPSYFVELENIPLSNNGKVDRKALPAPQGRVQAVRQYMSPRSKTEAGLVTIWQDVLRIEQVGIQDNFFELGGDSIKAVQIAARLRGHQLHLAIRDLFRYPTILELSSHVQPLAHQINQGPVEGEVGLTPIQQRLLEGTVQLPHHYNQAVMLHRRAGFDEGILRRVFERIVTHHDALRMRYREEVQGIVQWNHGLTEASFGLDVIDLRSETTLDTRIPAEADRLQRELHLEQGPLMRLGLMKTREGDHLLIVIHHLVVDGVSWRILFEDIQTGYEQIERGEEIRLPEKTDAFQTWSAALARYADSEAQLDEIDYWRQMEQTSFAALPVDELGTGEAAGEVTLRLSRDETSQLLNQVGRAYNTEINDILLTGMGLALQEWTGEERFMVDLEGHGREEIGAGVDVSRTVGWFTTMVPTLLDLGACEALSDCIKTVKEGLRSVPNKGLGYGVLKYLTAVENKGELKFNLRPEICFNYLGQFDGDVITDAFESSAYGTGSSIDPTHPKAYKLSMNGMVIGGELVFTCEYAADTYRRELVEDWMARYTAQLRQLIAHCTQQTHSEKTTSDFRLVDVEPKEASDLQQTYAYKVQDIYPLTPMQEGMLFHAQLDPDATTYFEQFTFRVEGRLDVAVFKTSLERLTERHEMLRTAFTSEQVRRPVQVVLQERQVDLQVRNQVADLESMKQADRQRGFELSQDALMRVTLVLGEDGGQHVIWSFHHILMDGWCMSILTQELMAIYRGLQTNQPIELGPVEPFSRYVQWLSQQDRDAARQYWSQYLATYEQQASVPRASGKTEHGGIKNHAFRLDQELTRGLEQLAREAQVTVNTVMQTIWGVLLQKYNQSEDVVFGAVVSGRPAEVPGIERMIGLFINTTPVRIRSTPGQSVLTLLQQVQDAALVSEAHSHYPLYEIQGLSPLKQGLIDHILVFENYPIAEVMGQAGERDEATFGIRDVEAYEQTNYDLTVVLVPGEALSIEFRYNAKVYEGAFIRRMEGHIREIAQDMLANAERPVGSIALVTPEEKQQLLHGFNDTAAEYPREATIHGLFEAQVERTPDAVAVVYGDQQLTYAELNARANQLAWTLREQGVGPDRIVAIIAERSVEMIVGIFGILKAGGAYLPIDPALPVERIHYMLEDSGSQWLVGHEKLLAETAFAGVKLGLTTITRTGADTTFEIQNEQNNLDDGDLKAISGPEHLAYVIYTSGSTGRPKGVMIEHRGVASLTSVFKLNLQVTKDDRVLQFASLSFDVSVWEMVMSLCNGAQLHTVSTEVIHHIGRFEEYIRENGITVITLPPAYLMQMDPEQVRSLRTVIPAGSTCPQEVVRKWSPYVNLINAYGPTEITICATMWPAEKAAEGLRTVPIGKPLFNIRVYILDSQDMLQPIGVAGELCIAGEGLARGYLNQPKLTAEKFVDNPFEPGKKMYRTGDLARWLSDGNLEYLGRIDQQVKIRGYRIECGEVETQLLAQTYIREAVVMAREDEPGQAYLCAYLVSDETVPVAELRAHLAEQLPDYMIPSYFVELDHIPLNTNGKVDHKALSVPDREAKAHVYETPRDALETQLVDLFAAVLGVNEISIGDSFFERGGHSLKAMMLVSRIHQQLAVELPLRELFAQPTVKALAEYVRRADESSYGRIESAALQASYPLSSAQRRLYVLHEMDPESTRYNMPGVVEMSGQVDANRLEHSIRSVIARHESLRTSFIWINGEPRQQVYEDVSLEWGCRDTDEAQAQELLHNFVRPFALDKGPLLRTQLLRLAEDRYWLMWDIHHIVSDGVSMSILVSDFMAAYAGEELAPLRIQYKDYAVWQQGTLGIEQMKAHEAYWLSVYAEEAPVLELPTDRMRPTKPSSEGGRVHAEIHADVMEGLKQIVTETGATLYMVLLAAYNVWLHKYTRQTDIVVGTPVSGRTHSDTEPMIGMFVNTLALRNAPSGDKRFTDFVHEVKQQTLKAFEHQDYPFEELVEKLNIRRDQSRNPLFDTMLVLQNMEQSKVHLGDIELRTVEQDNSTTKMDLTMVVVETQQGLHLSLEYSRDLFDDGTVKRLLQGFCELIKATATDSYVCIRELKLEVFQHEEEEDEIELFETIHFE